jgi:hypothetical protein
MDQIFLAVAFFVMGAIAGAVLSNLWQNRRKAASRDSGIPPQGTGSPEGALPAEQANKEVGDGSKSKQKKAILLEKEMPKDMIVEINDILQELLLSSPLKGKKLKVTADPPFGVSVWVDGVKHASVEELKDEKTKHLIQQAIKEWEVRVIARSDNR